VELVGTEEAAVNSITHAALEATQGQIVSQSPTKASSRRSILMGVD